MEQKESTSSVSVGPKTRSKHFILLTSFLLFLIVLVALYIVGEIVTTSN